MSPHSNQPDAGKPRCLDCAQHHRHYDTCPQRSDLLDLVERDVAILAARPGRPYVRPLHRAERAALEACGCPAPRRETRRWRVHVEPLGPDAVRRTICRDGQRVAQMDDTAIESGAR